MTVRLSRPSRSTEGDEDDSVPVRMKSPLNTHEYILYVWRT